MSVTITSTPLATGVGVQTAAVPEQYNSVVTDLNSLATQGNQNQTTAGFALVMSLVKG